MSEISEERTLIAILQTRVMTLDADKSALEAENAKLRAALREVAELHSEVRPDVIRDAINTARAALT